MIPGLLTDLSIKLWQQQWPQRLGAYSQQPSRPAATHTDLLTGEHNQCRRSLRAFDTRSGHHVGPLSSGLLRQDLPPPDDQLLTLPAVVDQRLLTRWLA